MIFIPSLGKVAFCCDSEAQHENLLRPGNRDLANGNEFRVSVNCHRDCRDALTLDVDTGVAGSLNSAVIALWKFETQ